MSTQTAPVFTVQSTKEELMARIKQLELKNEFQGNPFKVTDKGGVSVYGLQRYPVTLTYKGWIRLLDKAVALRAFLEENKSRLYMGKDKSAE